MDAAKISSKDAQQVQNQLDHLASTHLIVRIDNDGSVKDGSRYLYRKDSGVRKHRTRIIRLADNPEAAAKVATKRRPIVRGVTVVHRARRQALKKHKKLPVLYLSSNPKQDLRLDREFRQVQDEIRGSLYRDNITVEYRPAADLQSLVRGMNDFRPAIVHFSGHGSATGIAVDTGDMSKGNAAIVPFSLLAKALTATDAPPQIVVLSSCSSAGARKALFPSAKIVIVMRDSISDLAAAAFATNFYAAVAAGQSIKSAFAQGRNAIEVVSLSEADTPELLVAPGIDPATIVLT